MAETNYKYGQQIQVTVRNHNRSTALARTVLKYWGLKPILWEPNLALSFCPRSLIGEMTDVEKYLLESQEFMQVLGKGNRPVHVLFLKTARLL